MPDAVSRFGPYAASYDSARPAPPRELVRFLIQWSGVRAPDVVDIGAGTGLSTMIWAGSARQVIAVEPSSGMRQILEQKIARPGAAQPDPAQPGPAAGGPADTRFIVTSGAAEVTGLPDGCADIVTASQAMHWFDATRALPEIARLLRPGGVLAAYDCDWPPDVDWQTDAAFSAYLQRMFSLEDERRLSPPHAGKRHRETLAASGLFRYVTEVALHGCEQGDAARLVAAALSQGGARALLDTGLTEDGIGITALREVAAQRLPGPRPWWWTYRVRLAVK